MNILKTVLICLTLSAAYTLIVSCSGNSNAEKTGKEYISAYICPMHCEGSGNDQAGKCPVCKMDYVKNENYKGETKESPSSHEGHDHGSHEGQDHGSHEGQDHGNHEGHNH